MMAMLMRLFRLCVTLRDPLEMKATAHIQWTCLCLWGDKQAEASARDSPA